LRKSARGPCHNRLVAGDVGARILQTGSNRAFRPAPGEYSKCRGAFAIGIKRRENFSQEEPTEVVDAENYGPAEPLVSLVPSLAEGRRCVVR
jgi:hypothetical protein